MAEHPLHPVNREHLAAMTGELGIWQHAVGSIPDHGSGYTTDDVARAMTVDLLHARELGWDAVRPSAWRSLRYLRDAWSPTRGRFRNLRDADGRWLDDAGTEDTQGRACLALGLAIAEPPDPAFAADARMLFANVLPAARRLGSLRAISSCVVGAAAALRGDVLGHELHAVTLAAVRDLTDRLVEAFRTDGATPAWPWPEPKLTYENALLPQALIAGGDAMGDAAAVALGLRVLGWLTAIEQDPDGTFLPVGNHGWWRRDGRRARFDQQPIEATAHVLAAEAAFLQSADPGWLLAAERAYAWFLGDNATRLCIADPAIGACHDGLGPTRVNVNQGAESTLMWLMALEHMRALRRVADSSGAVRSDVREPAAPQHGG